MKTINLGAEHDKALTGAIRKALEKLKAVRTDRSHPTTFFWDFEWASFNTAFGSLTIEWETYIGVTVTGEESTVDRFVALVKTFL